MNWAAHPVFTACCRLSRARNKQRQTDRRHAAAQKLSVFSEKYEEICDRVIRDMDRSCTILDGTGGYSRKPVKVVVLLARKTESNAIFRLVKQIDNQAFISQANVRGVYGEGFDQIKT